MRRKSLLLSVFLACFLFPAGGRAQEKPQPEGQAGTIERLVGLCKLWGYVKYFHPSLAYRSDIDWDAALVATVPKVRSAKTSGDYAAALQYLLDVLDDSSTRVLDHPSSTTPSPKNENQQLDYRLTEDGILIITVGDYFALTSPASQEKLKAALSEITKARAIVFDLRSAEPTGEFGKFQLASIFSQIERLITTNTIVTPGERRRIHYGYKNTFGFQYKSGLFTQDGEKITPAQGARDMLSITILNKDSGLLRSTVGLQAAGKGLVVFEGDVKDNSIGRTETLKLSDALTAQVRVSDFIYEDGTSGDVQPDAVVTVPGESDKAMETALALARNSKPSSVVRKKLAGSVAPARDKSYPEMKYPSVEYRLLAAFRIWNVFNYFFPYKHLMGEDWDSLLPEFIAKFEQAKDEVEYSLTVAEMVTHVHDSHAYVSGPVINKSLFGSYFPAIRVRNIEGSSVVTSVGEAAKLAGVKIGDVVLKIDGEDAKARLARYGRYISTSTLQSNLDKASLYFLSGNEGSVITLTLRDRANKVKEVKLNRKYEDFNTLYHKERSGDILRLLDGNIGYADLDRLTLAMIDEMFEKFKNTKAIIFDMRGYPNGTVWSLAPRLTEQKELPAAFFETPIVTPVVGIGESKKPSEAFYQIIPSAPPGKSTFKGPTVMLIDERTMSQAEHTGLFLRAANGTKFVGSHTAGANGELTTFSVPGGISIGLTGQSVKFPDGRQLQRVGLVPDIEVKPTIKGIQEGRDEVLESAIRYLHRELRKK